MFQPSGRSGKSAIASLLRVALVTVMLITTAVAQEAPRDSGVLIKPPTVMSPTPRVQTGTSAKVGSTRRRRRPARRTRSRAALRRAAAIRAAAKARQVPRVIVGSAESMPHSMAATSTATTPRRPRAPISGGVLNGRALVLPLPVYPPIAKASNTAGTVEVRVVIDENGKITEAEAISGPNLLRKAAENAAREARFAPTQLSGQPVSVTGIITYEFVVPQ